LSMRAIVLLLATLLAEEAAGCDEHRPIAYTPSRRPLYVTIRIDSREHRR